MAKGARILVVDDDPEIRDILDEYLSDEGFVVVEAPDGETMRRLIAEDIPDLVLLDVRLPDEDGLFLARELQQSVPETGIVMISGKEDVVDRVSGLEMGADDYIVKPFHLREVLARVRSVLRRRDVTAVNGMSGKTAVAKAQSPSSGNHSIYRFAGWALDEEGRGLTSPQGGAVVLTGGEFDLLLTFVSHPNRALSRDQLLDYARSREAEPFDRSIDVQVGRLRRKIERDPKRPALIKTIRNVGYMFDTEVTVTDPNC